MQVELFSAERKQVSIETILYICSLGLIIDSIPRTSRQKLHCASSDNMKLRSSKVKFYSNSIPRTSRQKLHCASSDNTKLRSSKVTSHSLISRFYREDIIKAVRERAKVPCNGGW